MMLLIGPRKKTKYRKRQCTQSLHSDCKTEVTKGGVWKRAEMLAECKGQGWKVSHMDYGHEGVLKRYKIAP